MSDADVIELPDVELFDGEADESPLEEATEVRAQQRAEIAIHRRILARREDIAREAMQSRRQHLVTVLGGLVVGAGLIALIFWTPILRVRHVEVVGAEHETRESVLAAAGVPRDVTLAEIPVSRIAASVETLPWVGRAEVTRRLPWTVRIAVIERRPVAVVEAAGALALVDEEGIVLENLVPEADVGPLIRLRGTRALPEPGDRWSDKGGLALIEAVQRLPAELVPLVAGISLEESRLVAVLRDGVEVAFGPPEDVEAKATVLIALLEDLARRGVRVSRIDVSSAASPAVLPATEVAPR